MTSKVRFHSLLLTLLFVVGSGHDALAAPSDAAIRPVSKDGVALNLDFEDGTLRDWTTTGKAFDKQPVRGDTVAKRRGDMRSDHQGEYWIGGFEIVGDDPQGTLTSVPF